MIAVNPNRCPQNHHCPTLRACPAGAIKQNGNKAPTIDNELCIECGLCVGRCPAFYIVQEPVPTKR